MDPAFTHYRFFFSPLQEKVCWTLWGCNCSESFYDIGDWRCVFESTAKPFCVDMHYLYSALDGVLTLFFSNSFHSSESNDKQPIIKKVVHLHLSMKLRFSRNINRVPIIYLHYSLPKHRHMANIIGLFSKLGLKAMTFAWPCQTLSGFKEPWRLTFALLMGTLTMQRFLRKSCKEPRLF